MYRKNGNGALIDCFREAEDSAGLQNDVILKLRFVRYIRRGINARKASKIVDEVSLVEIAARQGDLCPVDGLGTARDLTQNPLESLHAAEKLGGQSDLLSEELDEASFAQSNLIRYAGNRAVWKAAEIADGEANSRMRRNGRLGDPAEQRALQNIEF